MIEKLQYKDVESLQTLSLEELQALWELVPTERQKAYRTAYDRELSLCYRAYKVIKCAARTFAQWLPERATLFYTCLFVY